MELDKHDLEGPDKRKPHWKLLPLSGEVTSLCQDVDYSFLHVWQSTNGLADFLAKIGVLRSKLFLDFFFLN